MRWYLYTLTNKIDGKIYVGLTSRPRKRYRQHLTGHGSQLVRQAVQAYGEDAFDFQVLVCTDFEHGCKLEQVCIRHFGALSPHGYNLDSGGSTGHRQCEESRRRISAAQKAHFADPDARKCHAEAQKVRLADPETRRRISEAKIAYFNSPEARKRNSEAIKAYFAANPEARARHSRAVKAYFADPANRVRASLSHKGQPGRRGEASGTSKLTDQAVREIRKSELAGRQLAAMFGVSDATISNIRRNKSWTHVL